MELPDEATMAEVRQLPFIDFIEPARIATPITQVSDTAYLTPRSSAIPRSAGDSQDSWLGCYPPSTWGGDPADRVEGNEIISWSNTGSYNRVTDAWVRSQGDNVRVAVLDTGLDPAQTQFSDAKFSGAGRTITRLNAQMGVSGSPTWRDDCGHGTRIAGIIAAPRDGANMAGIAYKSDLISVRVGDDVYMGNAFDVIGALDIAALSGAQIIQMAWKTDKWFSGVSDVIKAYYHRSSGGILFVGAAGTSTQLPNAIFPAEMGEVIAVSAIEKNGALASNSHYGPAIDLAGFVSQPSTGVPTPFRPVMGRLLYRWSTGATTRSIIVSPPAPGQSATYEVMVTDTYEGKRWSRQHTVSTLPASDPRFDC